MSEYVTNGVDTFTPTLIDGYESERASATIVHQILNRSAPDVTVRPAGMRTGTLRMVFADSTSDGGGLGEPDSKACEDAHAAGGVFNLISSDRSSIVMSYVPHGRIRRALDDVTRDVWILEVEFHEVQT